MFSCLRDFLVKYILFGVNLLFFLGGLGLIIVGSLILSEVSDFNDILPVEFLTILVIVLGSFVFLIAFFGCCGAIKESRCLLIVYAVCMALLAAVKIYLAVLIFRGLNSLLDTVTGWLVSAFNNEQLRDPYNALEYVFSCCGTTGAGSYGDQALPPTCCAQNAASCEVSNAHMGCIPRLDSYFDTFGTALGYVVIVIIIVELVAMLFAAHLSNVIYKKNRSR